ncbi:hypothetical protein ABIA32_006707 [Streptacidiphilus sp. MAP12-20]|uniref:hypothetical protein n=1 Tax=Streptacidiphilus sp. MAP12-20 TaxID=3156299 RepID=UPI00351716E7
MLGWERITPASRYQVRLMPTLAVTALGAGLLSPVMVGSQLLWLPAVEPVFLVPFFVALRFYRTGLYADRDRVRIRSPWRTRTVAMADIAEITSAPRRGDLHDPMRSDAFRIVLRTGETLRTPVRVHNPAEGERLIAAAYERDDFRRFGDHLRALVHNHGLDDEGKGEDPPLATLNI